MHRAILLAALLALTSPSLLFGQVADRSPLPGTEPLTMEGDIAAQLVEGVDRFLLRKLEESVPQRARFWKRDESSPAAYEASLQPNRQRLAEILGVVDIRVPFDSLQMIANTKQSALVGSHAKYDIYAVRWPVVRDVFAEGLLLLPKSDAKTNRPSCDVVAIPDSTHTPEQICGLAEGVPAASQYARRLAEAGCRVLVPVVINREMQHRNSPGRQGGAKLTNREFLYRPGFEMGRHLVGYEVQKVLAAVDWLEKEAGDRDANIGVVGYGDGGMLALYAKALDPRIDAALVSGYVGSRQQIWKEPIDRNVFGLLEQFGDAELIDLAAKGTLVIEASPVARQEFPGEGGAPAELTTPAKTLDELKRYLALTRQSAAFVDETQPDKDKNRAAKLGRQVVYVPRAGAADESDARFGSDNALNAFLAALTSGVIGGPGSELKLDDARPELRAEVDVAGRHARQMYEIERDTQQLLAESPYARAEFMKKLDTSSVEAYQKSVEEYREFFATQVIGRFDDPLLEPKPRSRKAYETDKWTGYEVVLDVFPDVIAYGLLLLPKDLKEGERRPVVVCQHGLEGRPQDVIGEQGFGAYSAFAGKLAERGFITFAPQNLYIGKDKFRTLQRKANPLGKTLFSVIVPQHQQICNWLSSLPMVDKDRIAFYGLSYGGKSAMRIPPLVPNYCLSICSADFNDWVWKNASTRSPYSYVWTGEYEIFEWNLGHTFNYAEMAALIAPKPFMVERGMFDGVAPDETVAYEFAKVRHLYEARLKLQDRCEIEFFDGPHKIHGVATYAFLHKHLNWPAPAAAE